MAVPMATSRPASLVARFQPRHAAIAPRFYSVISATPDAQIVNYDQVKKLAEHPDPHTVLIDVREPVEFEEGHIPGALNVPFKSSPGALELSPEDFSEAFGFPKPDKKDLLVFYCLGGVRLTAAEELAQTFGYKNRANYVGLWEDWKTHENAAEHAAGTN